MANSTMAIPAAVVRKRSICIIWDINISVLDEKWLGVFREENARYQQRNE
jgi:hypothetical protein